jgi:hypothetical protein
MHKHDHHQEKDHSLLEHHHTIWDELICHLPIAIFSVAFGMIILSMLTFLNNTQSNGDGAHLLFHNFHFLHLLFAATGTVLTFRRYSKKILIGIVIGFLVPTIFCTLSDAVLPYFAGKLLGVDMHFHWCFLKHFKIVLPFVLIGMINGWFMSGHSINKQLFYSRGFHFLHIFVSSMASLLYLVSFGFYNWWKDMGTIFIFLILAVLIPCTLSDIIIPILFAKIKKDE